MITKIKELLSSFSKKETEIDDKDNSELDDACASLFCLLYTSPSPRDRTRSRMPSSA